MLMTLTPSEPSATNTTTATPPAKPHGNQPVVSPRNDHGSIEEHFIQIGKVEAIVFGDVGEALWFIPNDFHGLYCIYNLIRC
jgi:hypothetical protein